MGCSHSCMLYDGLMTSTRQNKESTKGVLAEPLENGYILHGRTTYSHSVKFLQSDYMLFYHAVYIPLVISLLSAISSVSCSVFCSSEVAGKNSFSSNWNGFVSATVLSIFPHLFSPTLLQYYSFQLSNRYAMRAEAKPFLCTSIRRTLTLDIRS